MVTTPKQAEHYKGIYRQPEKNIVVLGNYVGATTNGVYADGVTGGNPKAQEALRWAAMWAEALK